MIIWWPVALKQEIKIIKYNTPKTAPPICTMPDLTPLVFCQHWSLLCLSVKWDFTLRFGSLALESYWTVLYCPEQFRCWQCMWIINCKAVESEVCATVKSLMCSMYNMLYASQGSRTINNPSGLQVPTAHGNITVLKWVQTNASNPLLPSPELNFK